MAGDYSRIADGLRKRYSAVLKQQGRVDLDSDWNAFIGQAQRRWTTQAEDTFGAAAVPAQTTPDGFLVTATASAPADFSLGAGRCYVDGLQAEIFAGETFDNKPISYLNQPFYPEPPALAAGSGLVYLDVWEREVTAVQDQNLLDVALGGVDTTTRLQTVWQVKALASPANGPALICATDLSSQFPPSAGRIDTRAVGPTAPTDPCILPDLGGYRGIENRLYRVQIHVGGDAATARWKWSRENASVVSRVTAIATAASSCTLTVDRIGRDDVLRFSANDWVELTDDYHELLGYAGFMAQIVGQPNETSLTIALSKPLPATFPGFAAADPASRNTRLIRWEQQSGVDADGLLPIATAAWMALEDGVEIKLGVDASAPGGQFHVGDFWCFDARTANASVQTLTDAPPLGVRHHYCALATYELPSGGPLSILSSCRLLWPPAVEGDDCCCTVVVAVGGDIQKAIDGLPDMGGCVCLKVGLHEITKPLTIYRANVKLEGECPGARVRLRGDGAALIIGDPNVATDNPAKRIEVNDIEFTCEGGVKSMPGVICINYARYISINRCTMFADAQVEAFGIVIRSASDIAVASCAMTAYYGGVFLVGENNQDIRVAGNAMHFDDLATGAIVGVICTGTATRIEIADNAITGVYSGIVVNDTFGGPPNSLSTLVSIRGNSIVCIMAKAVPVKGALIGIDLAASGSIALGNSVALPFSSEGPIGVRIAGVDTQAVGNTIFGYSATNASGTAPLGIQVGAPASPNASPTINARALDNSVGGCLVGVQVEDVAEGLIGDNVVTLADVTGHSTAIRLTKCVGVQVERNQIGGYVFGVYAILGLANRIAGNTIGAGGVGVALAEETSATVSDNRIAVMLTFAIVAAGLLSRTEIVQNRVSNCALTAKTASICVVGALGMLRIAGNEVLDSGVTSAGNVTPVYGIVGLFVLQATVEGNEITYSSPFTRDPTAEDRALLMCGLIQLTPPSFAGPPTLGYPVQITGNNFAGTGATALVQLIEFTIGGGLLMQFERVMFCNNDCNHISASSSPSGAATIKLVGNTANVVANQVNSLVPIPAVDFGGMKGLYIGNIAAGSVANLGSPAPAAGLNL